MVDITNIESLADREVKAGGVKLTASSVLAIIAFLSTVDWWFVWRLYSIPKDRRSCRVRPNCIPTTDGCHGC